MSKSIFKVLLQYYLKYITKLALFIHRPVIVAVAGSVNKGFVKEEIIRVLKKNDLNVRGNPKNFNTEIGLPLAILGLESGYNSYRAWWPIVRRAPSAIWRRDFPDYLVLELGASDPGDMRYLLSIVRPRAAVVTDITQRYLESFSDMNGLCREYADLAAALPANGLLVLNCDNARVKRLAENTAAAVTTVSLDSAKGDWSAGGVRKTVRGQEFPVSHGARESRARVEAFGHHHVYAYLFGRAVNDYVTEISTTKQ